MIRVDNFCDYEHMWALEPELIYSSSITGWCRMGMDYYGAVDCIMMACQPR
jgi:hypothetical protein